MSIHPTAVIDPSAGLGKDVTVGPFSVIAGNVEIGNGCKIGPHVTIHQFTSLGSACTVHAGAVLGDLPQDLAFDPSTESYVKIGAECIIREGVTIHRGTKSGTVTETGENCYLMAFSHLAHNVRLGDRVILANGALLAGYCEVGDGAFISGNTSVHQFTRIGRLAMLAGNSGLSKDLAPFCTTRPSTTNHLLGLNVVGMRRAGMGPGDRKQAKEAFKILFRSGLAVPAAISEVKAAYQSGPALEMAIFAEESKRGILTATD